MSQLSVIISQRTYNRWRNLIPELAILRTKWEVGRWFTGQHSSSTESITVTTTFLLSERGVPNSIAMCTFCSSNLEKADLHRHTMDKYTYTYATWVKHAYGDREYNQWNLATEEDQSMIEALLLPQISTRANCTCREDSLRLKHIYDGKLSFNWRELIVVIHCTVWSAFTVETYTIPQIDNDDNNDYNNYDDYEEHDNCG